MGAGGEVIALLYELGRDQNEASGGVTAGVGEGVLVYALSLNALLPINCR